MRPTNRTFSLLTGACLSFAGVIAVGCLETSDAADVAAPAEGEATARSEQGLDLGCEPTIVAPDAKMTTAPADCESNQTISLGDLYPDVLCNPYVVEYSYKPGDIEVSWEHTPWSKAECEAMRASFTLYSFSFGAWLKNGTASYHGRWCTTFPCNPSGECNPELDAGVSVPKAGVGTKWRVSATASAKNCRKDGSACYPDYKRLSVTDQGSCVSVPR